MSLLLAVVGCGQDAESPTAPESTALEPASALSFRQLSAGYRHACGVTSDNRAYCWGANYDGQLGDGTTISRWTPRAVAGKLSFGQVVAGALDRYATTHSCGVTTGNRAYCWGGNDEGQLGNGTTTPSLKPVAVAGGLQFSGVSPGGDHGCGITTDKRAYCWGYNYFGQLGDGSEPGVNAPTRLVPFAVVGGLSFTAVTSGENYTCGVATDSRAYCWGGLLGDGTLNVFSSTPVAVAGAM